MTSLAASKDCTPCVAAASDTSYNTIRLFFLGDKKIVVIMLIV